MNASGARGSTGRGCSRVRALGLDVKRYVKFTKSFSRTGEGAEFVDLKRLEEWYNA